MGMDDNAPEGRFLTKEELDNLVTNATAVLSVAAMKFKAGGKYHPSVKDSWKREEAAEKFVALVNDAVADLQRECEAATGVKATKDEIVAACVQARKLDEQIRPLVDLVKALQKMAPPSNGTEAPLRNLGPSRLAGYDLN